MKLAPAEIAESFPSHHIVSVDHLSLTLPEVNVLALAASRRLIYADTLRNIKAQLDLQREDAAIVIADYAQASGIEFQGTCLTAVWQPEFIASELPALPVDNESSAEISRPVTLTVGSRQINVLMWAPTYRSNRLVADITLDPDTIMESRVMWGSIVTQDDRQCFLGCLSRENVKAWLAAFGPNLTAMLDIDGHYGGWDYHFVQRHN